MRQLARFIFPVAAIVLGLLVSLVLAEIILTVLGLPRFEQERKSHFTKGLSFYDSPAGGYLMYRLSPHSSYLNIYSSNPRGYFDEHNTVTIRANNRGFRGNQFAARTDSSIIRIAFLGDSFTMGEGVKFEDTYPEKTAAMLSDDPRVQAVSGKVESCNFGMLAYNTTQEYFLLREEVLSMDPDLIVLGYVLNDAAGPYFDFDPLTNKVTGDQMDPFWLAADSLPPDNLLYRLRTFQLLWNFRYQHSVSGKTAAYYEYLYGDENPHWAENRRSLRSIIDLCEARQIPLVVLCFPLLYRMDKSYPFASIHDSIAQIVGSANGEGTAFVDMLPHFEGYSPGDLWVHPTDQHPNEKAHHLTAEVLVRCLLDNPGHLQRVIADKAAGGG